VIALSVIIPVHQGACELARALEALAACATDILEVIVVDDGSGDESAAVAAHFGATVIDIHRRRGPAHARNVGASAAGGDVLVFIDADCLVHTDTMRRIRSSFEEDSSLDAVFGSYDDAPPAPGIVSQYKNLQHHFVHQNAREQASTFWTGCGAVRRDVFFLHGGFHERYERASIEDVEFGCRLSRAGGKIKLDREIQVTHLKEWTLRSLLYTDIFLRALPWTELTWRERWMPNDLNLSVNQRVSVALVLLLTAVSVMAGVHPVRIAIGAALALGAGLLGLNYRFYGFLARRRGIRFACGGVLLHALSFLYSGLAFLAGTGRFWIQNLAQRTRRERNGSWYMDPLVAAQKRAVHLEWIRRNVPAQQSVVVLKTDAFEEAYGDDALLSSLPEPSLAIGMDIDCATVHRAAQREHSVPAALLAADVRDLPFADASIDVVVSNSTLDHFSRKEDIDISIRELARILKPGGRLLITFDNPRNLLYQLFRGVAHWTGLSFRLGHTLGRRRLLAALESAGLEVRATDWLIHNPRFVSTLLFLSARRWGGRYAARIVAGLLRVFAALGHLPTRSMTACFVAACAEKPAPAEAKRIVLAAAVAGGRQ
jgi:glycosyltransferase involved in cell wall biosynthesis